MGREMMSPGGRVCLPCVSASWASGGDSPLYAFPYLGSAFLQLPVGWPMSKRTEVRFSPGQVKGVIWWLENKTSQTSRMDISWEGGASYLGTNTKGVTGTQRGETRQPDAFLCHVRLGKGWCCHMHGMSSCCLLPLLSGWLVLRPHVNFPEKQPNPCKPSLLPL